jgi:hypothetical protein
MSIRYELAVGLQLVAGLLNSEVLREDKHFFHKGISGILMVINCIRHIFYEDSVTTSFLGSFYVCARQLLNQTGTNVQAYV